MVLIFGSFSPVLNAQLIDNSSGQAFTDQPFFSPVVITRHRIKSISGHFIHYKLGDRLRETDYYRKYSFNEEGILIEQQEFTLLNYKNDTSINRYKYDNYGNITQFVHSDRNGAYGFFYEFDDKNRRVYIEYRRRYGKNETRDSDELGVESIVYSEKSTFKEYPKQLQETVYNTRNIPYKDIYTYYDEDSLIIGKTERLRRTHETKITTYSRNMEQLIDTIKISSNREGVQDREFVFSYNKRKYLTKKEEFIDEELALQYEVIYDDVTRLANDFLIQNVSTNFIRDLYLDKYEYFDY